MQNNRRQLVVEVRFIDSEVGKTLPVEARAQGFKRVEVRDGENDEEVRLVMPLATEIMLRQGKREGRVYSKRCLQARGQVRSSNNVQLLGRSRRSDLG